MKLKKIASLALAGIMAVSMLAGCNTATRLLRSLITNWRKNEWRSDPFEENAEVLLLQRLQWGVVT